MTTVFDDGSNTPGLHALVVGVSDYSSGVTNDTMSLDSAVPSAEAIARWIYEDLDAPGAPLRTLELLLSPKAPTQQASVVFSQGRSARGAQTVTVERACMGLPTQQGSVQPFGVAGAMSRWFERCNRHEDNTSFLYLCGHGADIARQTHFFCEKFALTPPAAALNDAINLSDVLVAMRFCLARRQLFFFDCCRDTPSWVLGYDRAATAPIRDWIDNLPATARTIELLTLWATSSGQRAGADDASRSRFAKALLEVLRGPACDQRLAPHGSPSISSMRIQEAMENLAEDGFLEPWKDQSPTAECSKKIAVHVPATPVVPVRLDVDPAKPVARVLVDGTPCVQVAPGDWRTVTTLGTHVAAVEYADGSPAHAQDIRVGPTHARESL